MDKMRKALHAQRSMVYRLKRKYLRQNQINKPKTSFNIIKNYINLKAKDKMQANLLIDVVKNLGVKPNARRYSKETKRVATSICFQSSKAYNYASKFIPLPAQRTVQRAVSKYEITEGIDNPTLKALENATKEWSTAERLVVLLVDEMSIKKHIGII
uniref:CSON009004 protein n=1 Tax=Culicoides sonorensis TaxID=179676 RepID=A0A336LG96_CULSO